MPPRDSVDVDHTWMFVMTQHERSCPGFLAKPITTSLKITKVICSKCDKMLFQWYTTFPKRNRYSSILED